MGLGSLNVEITNCQSGVYFAGQTIEGAVHLVVNEAYDIRGKLYFNVEEWIIF